MEALTVEQHAADAAWITAALRGGGVCGADDAVVAVAHAPIGTGQSADSFRIGLTWQTADAGLPSTVVAKFSSADPVSRSMGIASGMYEREALFYRDLAPRLQVRVPAPYYAEFDSDTGGFSLILEDLSPARPGEQLSGCSVEEARTVIRNAARLHGGSWDDSGMAADSWLRTGIRSMVDFATQLPDFQSRFAAEFGDRVGADTIKLADKLLALRTEWFRFVQQPKCLWHRDFRADNLMLDVGGRVGDIAIIDWQTVAYGPGVCDLSQFLGGSLTIADRRRHEHDLVREYFEELRECGVGITWDACWELYRVGAIYSMFTLMHAPLRVKRTERGDLMWGEWAARHTAQVLDLDSVAALVAR